MSSRKHQEKRETGKMEANWTFVSRWWQPRVMMSIKHFKTLWSLCICLPQCLQLAATVIIVIIIRLWVETELRLELRMSFSEKLISEMLYTFASHEFVINGWNSRPQCFLWWILTFRANNFWAHLTLIVLSFISSELFSHVFSPPKTERVINQNFESENHHVYAQPLLNLSQIGAVLTSSSTVIVGDITRPV